MTALPLAFSGKSFRCKESSQFFHIFCGCNRIGKPVSGAGNGDKLLFGRRTGFKIAAAHFAGNKIIGFPMEKDDGNTAV